MYSSGERSTDERRDSGHYDLLIPFSRYGGFSNKKTKNAEKYELANIRNDVAKQVDAAMASLADVGAAQRNAGAAIVLNGKGAMQRTAGAASADEAGKTALSSIPVEDEDGGIADALHLTVDKVCSGTLQNELKGDTVAQTHPSVLYVHSDSCCRDNKNYAMLGYFSLLIMFGHFRKIKWNFPMVICFVANLLQHIYSAMLLQHIYCSMLLQHI